MSKGSAVATLGKKKHFPTHKYKKKTTKKQHTSYVQLYSFTVYRITHVCMLRQNKPFPLKWARQETNTSDSHVHEENFVL